MAKCNNLFKIKLGPEIMKEQYIFYFRTRLYLISHTTR